MIAVQPEPDIARLYAELFGCSIPEAVYHLRRWNLLTAIGQRIEADRCHIDERVDILRAIVDFSKTR